MTKEEINKKIFELQSDEDIAKFVDERLAELEANSEEKTVGQNYTDSFQDYISQKIHYKAVKRFNDSECPDLVYDDKTPYINLIKNIKINTWYSELTLFTTIFYTIHDYLPSVADEYDRWFIYQSYKGKRLSIKTISEEKVSFCSEKAGMAHNMFKFLGIDSEVVCGGRGNAPHAYNFVYPHGYGNEPMVLYDPSHFLNFVKGDKKISFGFYKVFKKQDYEKLKSGIPVQIDLSKTEERYRKLYGCNGLLDGYTFEYEMPTYIYGIENAGQYRSSGLKK